MRSKTLSVNVLVLALLGSGTAIISLSAQGITASVGSMHVQNNESALPQRISVSFNSIPLAEALLTVAKRSGIHVSFDEGKLPSKLVTYKAEGVAPKAVFTAILSGTGLRATPISTGTINIVRVNPDRGAPGQGVITGRVVDAKTGNGISGANVSIGNDRGVVTDRDGSFRLAGVVSGVHAVTVRLVGYAKQSQSVTVGDGATVTVDFKLEPSANVLDQVVVTGTIVQTELRTVPNAITVITAKQIEERGITKIDQLFRGDIPGLFSMNQGSGALLDEVTMFSRGATALSGSSAGISTDPNSGTSFLTNPIKTYIDGVELADSKYLSQIDPKSIERIEILTGPQASTIYGSNAINGVMQIFTKRGTTSRPQLNLNLLSGWVENNFSNARTPQHDYSAQVNGVEGRLSYNAGGSWNYIGPWTPAKQTIRAGGFGGARLEMTAARGRVTADAMLRRSITQNRQRGSTAQTATGYREAGWWTNITSSGLNTPATSALAGQTLGFVLGYAVTNWWSHELGLGTDASDAEIRYTARGYKSTRDTTLYLQQNRTSRRSVRYATTARVPVTAFAQAMITVGADAWHNLTSALNAEPQTLTGSLTNVISVSRQPGHNSGSFLQTQLGIGDRLFFTYGLRAEWNPDFGDEAQPNYAPRYGVAYTQEMGPMTVKLRGSYGRSTRPPQPNLKVAVKISDPSVGNDFLVPYYENFDHLKVNLELAPEHQQGGEGGLELYLGTRGSLVITRYNQTVDGLIARPQVDSVRSLAPNPAPWYSKDTEGYGYWPQYQYLNIGTIRNQGWELQGSMRVGPITTRGTYSWTKSRTVGVNSKYRSFFTLADYPQYQPGATFQYLPEHTWAFAMTYARGVTTVGLNITGTGRVTNAFDDFFYQSLHASIRLPQDRLNVTNPPYVNFNRGYAMADLTVSHHFQSRFEGVFQAQNLANSYKNDLNSIYASTGRQVKAGLRVRL